MEVVIKLVPDIKSKGFFNHSKSNFVTYGFTGKYYNKKKDFYCDVHSLACN